MLYYWYCPVYAWWSNQDRFRDLQLTADDVELLDSISEHFNKFDTDKSGQLDIQEFKILYADLVENNLTKKTIVATLRELDSNKDGKIAFNEYVNWLLKQRIQA